MNNDNDTRQAVYVAREIALTNRKADTRSANISKKYQAGRCPEPPKQPQREIPERLRRYMIHEND